MSHAISPRSDTLRSRLTALLDRLQKDQQGASFIEYIIVVGLVAIIAIGAFTTFGGTVITKLGEENAALENLQPGGT